MSAGARGGGRVGVHCDLIVFDLDIDFTLISVCSLPLSMVVGGRWPSCLDLVGWWVVHCVWCAERVFLPYAFVFIFWTSPLTATPLSLSSIFCFGMGLMAAVRREGKGRRGRDWGWLLAGLSLWLLHGQLLLWGFDDGWGWRWSVWGLESRDGVGRGVTGMVKIVKCKVESAMWEGM